MRRYLFIPVCFVALLVPVAVLAGNGEAGFDGVIHTLESRYHVRATQIPFMGLLSMISRKATTGGVDRMHIAEFDDLSVPLDGEELTRTVATNLGPAWERVIRETSRKGDSQTLIFMHPEGNRMGLFVLDADGHELDVVQVSVDPSHLSESVNHYRHHEHADGSGDDGD